MSRSRRSFAWSLILALLCAFVVSASPPTTQAARLTFTVTTTADTFNDPADTCNATPTDCTLREALNSVNDPANAGSTVAFNIPTDDPGFTGFASGNNAWIITPTLALPPITIDGTIVDGATQTDQVGNLNNDGAEIIIDGTNVSDSGGLWLQSNDNTVRGIGIINFKGDGAPGALKGVGIEVSGNGNIIQGNYIGIGIARTGTVAGPNIDAGIIVYGNSNLVGGNNTSQTTLFNVISGNTGDGILVNGGDNNNIAGNYIGTDASVTSAIPNGGNGINLRAGANGNTIGNYQNAAAVSFRNFIGGNAGYGIQITNSSNNKIYGNFVGLNKSGISKIGNGLGGIRVDGTSTNSATGNIIGGTTPSAAFMRNYVAGNAGAGIRLNGFGARLNQVVANYVGLGSNNAVPAPGGSPRLAAGIVLDGGASDNTVGGPSGTAAQNVVAGINGDGIRVAGLLVTPQNIARARNNNISGNYIGVHPNGTTAIANTGSGIVLENYVVNTTVGGTATDLRNLIANNGADGITIRGTAVQTTTIQKNTIRANIANGISIANALNTKVDGGDAAGANQITLNGANGIKVTDSLTTSLRFNAASSNTQNGVQISGGRYATLASNTLNTNTFNGVQIDTAALDTAITGNTIYTNTLKAVVVRDIGTQRVKILDNSMQGNGAGGIDLTPESLGAPGNASNPNHDINPPFNLRINQNGVLTGNILPGSDPAACDECTIQIFSANPVTRDRQGRDKLDITPTIAANGAFTATLGLVPAQLALTATDADGNTSEFAVLTRTLALAIVPTYPQRQALPGDKVVYTHQLVNNGTVDFDNIQLTADSSLNWTFTISPTSPIALRAGQSVPITLTLTLPTGSATNVREGLVDETTITARAVTATPGGATTTTATVVDRTEVLGQFVLQVIPEGRSGFGSPKAPNVDYSHILTNIGNQAGTVAITASTDLGWTTSVTPTVVTLQPGESAGITVRVVVPAGTQAGTKANTVVTISGDASTVFTDTMTVLVDPLASLEPAQAEAQAAAGQKVTFQHTVTNLSNGETTFRLTGVSSQGSQIRFISNSSNVTLNPDNSFTLNTSDRSTFTFIVEVTVDYRALRGDTDLISIGLTDQAGNVIGGANARDAIFVTRSATAPRLWFPMILNNTTASG
jgi:CSLREA domain-containing protein